MRSHRVLGAAIAVALMAAACGSPTPPQVTIANRSDAILTVGPGLVIPSCGSTTVSRDDYESALTKAGEFVVNDQTWDAPIGALVWWGPAIVNAAGSDPAGTITLIVSGTADPEVRAGAIPDSALPACGGKPRGIEPGTPQGALPVVTMEPGSP